ncbi:hypothetical protein Tco_0640993 [Tanacetum coccineum]
MMSMSRRPLLPITANDQLRRSPPPLTSATSSHSEDYHVGGSRGATLNISFVVNNTQIVYKSGGGPEEMVGKFIALVTLYMTPIIFGYGTIVAMAEKVKKDFYEKNQIGLGLSAVADS